MEETQNQSIESNVVSSQVEQKMQTLIKASVLSGKAWKIFVDHWRLYMAIVFPLFILEYAVSVGMEFYGQNFFISSESIVSGVVLSILMALYVISAIVISVLSGLAMLYAAEALGHITIKEAYRKAVKRFWPYVWVSILSGFVVGGGLLLFVIPGVVLAILLSLVAIIIAFEDERGMKLLIKSREYIRGYGWRVFWRYIFIGIIALILSLAIQVIAFIIGFPFIYVGDTIKTIVTMGVAIAGNILVVTPFILLYVFLIYENIKFVKGDINIEGKKNQAIRYWVLAIIGILSASFLIFSFGVSFYKLRQRPSLDYSNYLKQVESNIETGGSTQLPL